ncbi:MAG: ribonuclease P protein component [Rickettsiaceae bacterium]|nr:ribonuclease P protein component [Rickettsiaceae bacterium]
MQHTLYSLKNQKQFNLVNNSGIKYYSNYFILVICPVPHQIIPANNNINNCLYYGIKIGRKYSKKAVIRNKAKRRVRHLLRTLSIDQGQNLAIIIVPRKDFHITNFLELTIELKKFWNKNQKSLKKSP